jgi:hypothetical protein
MSIFRRNYDIVFFFLVYYERKKKLIKIHSLIFLLNESGSLNFLDQKSGDMLRE